MIPPGRRSNEATYSSVDRERKRTRWFAQRGPTRLRYWFARLCDAQRRGPSQLHTSSQGVFRSVESLIDRFDRPGVDKWFAPSGSLWCPRRDSNPGTWLRRPMLYPLSYEGGVSSLPDWLFHLVATLATSKVHV